MSKSVKNPNKPSASKISKASAIPQTRGYQQEMLEESLRNNIIIAMDTGSGKTHIAVLRLKIEAERELKKISWFFAPTVALCEQQHAVINASLPVSVGLVSGALEPDQWRDSALWTRTLETHRVVVSTPQVLLDALRHAYIDLGRDIGLLVFDEAHHAVDDHPYNRIMQEFYFTLPPRTRHSINGSRHSEEYVRPSVMSLTASPIFGGDVEKAFQKIEHNLDSIIRAPRINREELSKFVHRPVFKHVIYNPPIDNLNDPNFLFSTNLASLQFVVDRMDIENDPYVHSLRKQLAKATPQSREWHRLDQRLSKTITKEDSFTHKGLRDFCATATVILNDVGSWAADWYVWKVLEQAKRASDPLEDMMPSWQNREKEYLLGIIRNIQILPVSYLDDDIVGDVSYKVAALIESLLTEKEEAESRNDRYSGLVFVQRRDVVLALTEVLQNHPVTRDAFQVGLLLGTSESSRRHSFLDITRHIVKQSQDKTLIDFRIGEKNLIISTSVAEEGIDVQACGCVIRWDLPPNMASWAQSRGRARQKHSTFTLLFEQDSESQKDVEKWQQLEKEMVAKYSDPFRDMLLVDDDELGEEDDEIVFRVESTGATLTLQSAIPHLNHFCAVMPSRDHVDFRPIYELDPPDFPIGWHSIANRSTSLINPYQGPWSATVTLPRTLPDKLRIFRTEMIYSTKALAYRHVASQAYLTLYENGLLSDRLLPITDHEMEEADEEIEKRVGLANVSGQIDPWAPLESSQDEDWFYGELAIGDLPELHIFARTPLSLWTEEDGPNLYLPTGEKVQVTLRPLGSVDQVADPATFIESAREYTFMLFSSINGSRMDLDRRDFAYLFHPADGARDDTWVDYLETLEYESEFPVHGYNMNALEFGTKYEFPDDISMVREGGGLNKPYQFVDWQWDPLTEEEIVAFYQRYGEVLIEYPLLKVRPFHPRTNFLCPRSGTAPERQHRYLIPARSSVILLSPEETQYAFLLPSVVRALSMSLTTQSLRKNLFGEASPLSTIPDELLTVAITAPVSQERQNYQRLETLGDTVLKFVVVLQLLAQYPTWPEGYLTKRKDQAVSNVRLAKENLNRDLFQWIIRDRMLGKKWKPQYERLQDPLPASDTEVTGAPADLSIPAEDGAEKTIVEQEVPNVEGGSKKGKKKKSKQSQQISTKVLADVIESLIGAAYLFGGLTLGYECTKFFNLGLKNWLPLPERVDSLIREVREPEYLPPQVYYVERIIDYTFTRKLLLVEALTHPTHQQSLGTISYERLEFLGDSILDMVCTDYLYRAEGKNYSPGHMHMRKSAMVNGHMLAFLCLRAHTEVGTEMPRPDLNGDIQLRKDTKTIHLEQCLFHSSSKVLEEQSMTLRRFEMRKEEIEYGLTEDEIFPWAALTRLQAPKFFSDMIESIVGAVFLDSEGNFDVIRRILRNLGFMQILEHIVKDNVDVLHPVSRLALWASRHDKKVVYDSRDERGNVTCSVLLNEEPLEGATETDVRHGKGTVEEVRFAAAEKAIKILGLRTASKRKQ